MLKKRLVGIVTQKENKFLYIVGKLKYDEKKYLIPQLFESPMTDVVLFSDSLGQISHDCIKNRWTNENKFSEYLFTRIDGKIKRVIEYSN